MIGNEVKEYFQRHYNVTNYSDAVFIDFLELINDVAYRILYRNDPDLLTYSAAVTIVEGTKEYSITTLFGVNNYGYIDTDTAGVYLYDSETLNYEKLLYTSPVSSQDGYYIKSGKVYLTGELDKELYSLVLVYAPIRTTINDLTTDILNVPNDHIHWVASMVKELYDVYDNRDEYDVSYSEMIEKSFRNKMLDRLESKKRSTLDINTLDVFKC